MQWSIGKNPLEIINRLGFTVIYLISINIGAMLFFSWLLILGGLFDTLSGNITPQLDPTSLGSIPVMGTSEVVLAAGFYILLVPFIVYLATLLIMKAETSRSFFLWTFGILLLSYYISFTGFFTIGHHINNPAFYALVFLFISLVSCLLTFLWNNILTHSKASTSIPLKSYMVALATFFLFFVISLSARSNHTEDAYNIIHDFLFRTMNINIYFLDWGGFEMLRLTCILLVILTFSVLILNKVERYRVK